MSSGSESAKTAATVRPDENVVKCEDSSRRPAIPGLETRTESEILAEFPWEGHWEVWEREWAGARWVSDVRDTGVGASNPSISSCDTRTEFEILDEFPWEGHWEVWEREWGAARWVLDVRDSGVGVSDRACRSGRAA